MNRRSEIEGLMAQHEGILHAPFLDTVPAVFKKQMETQFSKRLGISWGSYKLDLKDTPSYVTTTLAKLSTEIASGLLTEFMNPIRLDEQSRHNQIKNRLLEVGEQISNVDQTGTQRAARRVLRAANKVVAERGWNPKPNDAEMFMEHLQNHLRMRYSSLIGSQRPSFTSMSFSQLQLDHPEGLSYQSPVNFAARFWGKVFEGSRFLQFAAKTGLMYGEHKMSTYREGAQIDINLSRLPELTQGINTDDLLRKPGDFPQYFEDTTRLTTDVLRKMGFLKTDQELDPDGQINFYGYANVLKHPSIPKLCAIADRAYAWNGGIRPSEQIYFNRIVVTYAYDRPSDEYLAQKFPDRYPAFAGRSAKQA